MGEYIGIDFDGTLVLHDYPRIGMPIPGAIKALEELQSRGHKLILYTMRSGESLQEAVDYLADNGITMYAVNENPTQASWTSSPKVYCSLYIDDAALGVPLVKIPGERPAVDWVQVMGLLRKRGLIS